MKVRENRSEEQVKLSFIDMWNLKSSMIDLNSLRVEVMYVSPAQYGISDS